MISLVVGTGSLARLSLSYYITLTCSETAVYTHENMTSHGEISHRGRAFLNFCP